MAEALVNPEFRDRFQTGFLQCRRDALATIVERARARGDLPPHLVPGTVADIVFGLIWYRLLATGQPLDRSLIDQLVAALTATSPAAGSRRRR